MTTDETTLSADEVCELPERERESRLAMIRRELLPRAQSTESLPDGRAWEFPMEPVLARRLEELVAFERVCCPGLGWELRPVRGGAALRLEVTGLDPGASVLWGTALEAEQLGRARLVAIAGALGLAASVCLLCALPIVLAAVGAAALADSMAGLDDPRWVSAAALVAGFVAWRVLDRRATRHVDRPQQDCGC